MHSSIPPWNQIIHLQKKALCAGSAFLLVTAFFFAANPLHAQTAKPDQAAAQQSAAASYGITPEEQAGIDKDISRHFGSAPANPGPRANLSGSLNPTAVRAAMRKVANWQLRVSQPYFGRIWTWSVLYAGFMAASPALHDPRYRDAMQAMAEKFHWELRSPHPNADDQSLAQTYLELYLLNPAPEKIKPTEAALANVIAGQGPPIPRVQAQIPWWWCDALFMAPPVWTRMYAATHDRKYLDYLHKHFWRTSDLLYDTHRHLYFRDVTYLHKTDKRGNPIFWSRGEGWVMAGLARTLEYLPKTDPDYNRYATQLRQMSAAVAAIQDPKNGMWHADMLDPEDYPQPEVSGSALITFALAWGVNHHILDSATYMPVIEKAWSGLVSQIYADGRLGNIQQTGAAPAHYRPSSSYTYGVGGFLLAGAQVLKLPAQKQSFTIQGSHFMLDGKPFQILSGEMHYARIPRAYWRDRMEMARAMGLNTIATYVFWNVHEPKPGVWNFSGRADLPEFLREAQEEHLHVVLRAGPYSCAEWEFGGYPAWLLANPKMETALRSNDPAYMVPVEKWIVKLGQEVGKYQIGRGGPIIAVQMENEYGDFGSDRQYLKHLRRIFIKAGFTDALLFTTNPTKGEKNGSIPGTYAAVNFGMGHAAQGLDFLEHFRPGQPLFAAEYWPGWFDHWGQPHQTRPIAPQVADLNTILSRGASLNLYMFHGGTSFGFMSGASWTHNSYMPDVTSYDYDAPLDEAGHPTPKYYAYRKVYAKYAGHPLPPVPKPPPVIAVPQFTLTQSASLWNSLPAPIHSETAKAMEMYDQAYGFILYRTRLHGPAHGALAIPGMNDYAKIYLDGKLIGTLDRRLKQDSLALNSTGATARLDILIENDGRINSTRMMRHTQKGAPNGITLDGKPLTGWQVYTLPMTSFSRVHFHTGAAAGGPAFYRGRFRVNSIGDTFLDVRGLKKGAVWIDGHAIGRYWNIGPQDTLYVPGPWLHKGWNTVTVFDIDGVSSPHLAGLTTPILNGPTRETGE